MLQAVLANATTAASYGLGLTGTGTYLRAPGDIRAVFYHGIGDGTSPCMRHLSDELPEATFAAQIDHLARNYRIVSLAEAAAAAPAGRPAGAKPLCCISFDDGLATVHSHAFPILKARGLPFCVFVNTAVVGNASLLWLHALSWLVSTHGLPAIASALAQVMDEAPDADTPRALFLWCRARYDAFRRDDIQTRLMAAFDADAAAIARAERLYMTWSELDELRLAGAEVHSHTHSHCPLDRLAETADIADEITRARDALVRAGFTDQAFVSFPFGMLVDYGTRAVEAAFAAGHGMIVEVGDGMNDPTRLQATRLMARVELGNVGAAPHAIHAALELRPLVKTGLKKLVRKAA